LIPGRSKRCSFSKSNRPVPRTSQSHFQWL